MVRAETGAELGLASGLFPQLVYRTSCLVAHPGVLGLCEGQWLMHAMWGGRENKLQHPSASPDEPTTVYGTLADCFASLTCFYPLKNQNKTGDGCGSEEYLCFSIVVRIKGRNAGEITLPHA